MFGAFGVFGVGGVFRGGMFSVGGVFILGGVFGCRWFGFFAVFGAADEGEGQQWQGEQAEQGIADVFCFFHGGVL